MTNITISVEIELAWGLHDLSQHHRDNLLSRRRQIETRTLERLLKCCERTDTPITIDIVGHLLHSQCDGDHRGPHSAEWFDLDPGTDVNTDPHFYAPDLVRNIQDSASGHEICTHTYSHILCEEVSDDVVAWEIETANEVHTKLGIPESTSFVAPRHQSPPYAVLADHGIEIIRVPHPSYSFGGSPIKTFWDALFKRHPSADVNREDSLIETYCTSHPSLTASYLQNGQRAPNTVFRVIPELLRRRHHLWYLKNAVRRANESGENVHLWTHLYNLSNDQQIWCVERFLIWLDRYRQENDVTVKTMSELV